MSKEIRTCTWSVLAKQNFQVKRCLLFYNIAEVYAWYIVNELSLIWASREKLANQEYIAVWGNKMWRDFPLWFWSNFCWFFLDCFLKPILINSDLEDVIKSGNGAPGNGNEFTAVIRMRSQNGSRNLAKRVNLPMKWKQSSLDYRRCLLSLEYSLSFQYWL